MFENSFSTLATYAAMSISALRWSLKNSVNSLSRWILLCSLTLTSLSQMSLASLYVNTQAASGLTQRTPNQRRRPRIIPLPRQQIFLIIFRRLFTVRYIGTFPISVNNRHPIILFEVHVYLPFPLDPSGYTNKLFDFHFRIRRHVLFR